MIVATVIHQKKFQTTRIHAAENKLLSVEIDFVRASVSWFCVSDY